MRLVLGLVQTCGCSLYAAEDASADRGQRSDGGSFSWSYVETDADGPTARRRRRTSQREFGTDGSVVEGNSGDAQEKTGTIELLAPNMKDVVYRLSLKGVGS